MLIDSNFQPAWWLCSPHAQTLWASTVRRVHPPETRAERLQLPDGDFVDLSILPGSSAFTVCVFHGLEGSLYSNYASAILQTFSRAGIRAVLMHFRGCSGAPNRYLRSYHSGHTEDMQYLFATLKARSPNTPLAAVGYSLGANALLKYQGEAGENSGLQLAIAVSPPFMLASSARRLSRGFSRVYQHHLVTRLKKKILTKAQQHTACTLDQKKIKMATTFAEFDNEVTAPLNGFDSAQDYYHKVSCRQFLHSIRHPSHIIYALDDPFFEAHTVPDENLLSPAVTLELTTHGGHVGFVAGSRFGIPVYWLEQRIVEILTTQML